MTGLEDFDLYVAEHGMRREHYTAAFALWIAEVSGGPVPKFEKVERERRRTGLLSKATTFRRR